MPIEALFNGGVRKLLEELAGLNLSSAVEVLL
jgi:hypothetical protein